jgi:hypothetical protein
MTCQCICRPYAPVSGQARSRNGSAVPAQHALGTPKRPAGARERQDLIDGSTGLEPGSKPQAQPTRNSQRDRRWLALDRAALANRGFT